jgi:serine/threonine protein kinase
LNSAQLRRYARDHISIQGLGNECRVKAVVSEDPPVHNGGVPQELTEQPSRPGSRPIPTPEPFGKYILLQRLGAGGMAEVFQAVAGGPEGFQRTLVIKRMLPQLTQDESFVQMFIDEAKLSGLLSHPNLVQIYEFGEVDGCFFIAMEQVQGRTLAAIKSKLASTGRMAPVDASVEIVRQVCVGLKYAHELQTSDGKSLGIVHRDISPPNVMIDFHGAVKILDFGIARVSHLVRDTRTQVGLMKGKVAYMSPEQVQLEEIDHRSDLFAVGIVLHEMLTGRRLFRSNTDYATSRMVLELKIPAPSVFNASVSPELDQIVMRALERDKDARYQSAEAMVSDLERVIQEQRLSPREHLKLLCELFPEGQASDKSVSPITGSFSSTAAARRASEEKATAPGTPADLLRGDAVTASSSSFARRLVSSPAAVRGPETSSLYPGAPLSPAPNDSGRRVAWAAAAMGGAILVAVIVALLTRDRSPRAVDKVDVAPVASSPAKPAITTVRLSVDSNPQDAEVTDVDSARPLGRTPFTVTLNRGTTTLTFRFAKAGHVPVLYKIIPDLDKTVRIDLPQEAPAKQPAVRVEPTPVTRAPIARKKAAPAPRTVRAQVAAPASKDCLLTVGSVPWAELWIDGKDVGQPTPVVHLPVTCGAHKLRFKRTSPEIDHVESVNVSPGQELKKNFNLDSADQDG